MIKHTYITDIQGAVVYPEIKEFEKNGELYFELPEVNNEYKYAMARNYHWALLVSKDLQQWVIAVAVMVGEYVGWSEIVEALKEEKGIDLTIRWNEK